MTAPSATSSHSSTARGFEAISVALPELRERFGVADLRVFGSVARGEAGAASDVDVLVDVTGQATFDGYMGLRERLEELLGRWVDLVVAGTLKPAFRDRVLAGEGVSREPRPMSGGTSGAGSRFSHLRAREPFDKTRRASRLAELHRTGGARLSFGPRLVSWRFDRSSNLERPWKPPSRSYRRT